MQGKRKLSLLILMLVMAFSFAFVACDQVPVQPVKTEFTITYACVDGDENCLVTITGEGSLRITGGGTEICENAFKGCTGLESVFFTGTIDEWAMIDFADSYYSNPLYVASDGLYIDGVKVTNEEISATEIKSNAFCGYQALGTVTLSDDVLFGEAMFYKTMLPYCTEAFITKVDADGQAEVFFENLDKLSNWECVKESPKEQTNGYDISFTTYVNKDVKEF